MGVSRVHHCISQELVAQQIDEPPALSCRCRQFVSFKQADQMVKNGEARWVVTKRLRGTTEETCALCQADPEVKNCALCAGTGQMTASAVWDTYNNDIVLVSRAAVDKKEKKYRPAKAMKTPRVATIESEHIERAYIDKVKEAQQRIEEYGRLILDARMYVGPARIFQIKPEPENDPKTGQGRDHDYGRPV